ncbi:RHS repeat-associated core domain-containing protein [Nocardioides jishulii]|uniref:RHS repeat-associated core domain-containing protein n=1 Tax=Nocardioides jishulii TaxID=2575440 RepID=A0A4U2YTV6_9ACTN|nr:RHS repeat-associated core domain-containing protein [Nocardioides jishulii]TKI64132.1 RHS repeat-associated core domain-containing protein [Nocardioides jishulii]
MIRCSRRLMVRRCAACGGVVSSSAYSVFGQPAGTGAVGLGDVYGYTGHAWDGDVGMHFARARWYDAGVGRFASEDPVDALNWYPYVGNQPYSYVDPTGEMAVSYAPVAEGGSSRSYDAAALAAIGTTNNVVITGVMRLFRDIATYGQVTIGCRYSVFTTLVTGAGFVAAQFSTVHFANALALKAARYAQAGTALVAFVDYAMSIRPGGACHAK